LLVFLDNLTCTEFDIWDVICTTLDNGRNDKHSDLVLVCNKRHHLSERVETCDSIIVAFLVNFELFGDFSNMLLDPFEAIYLTKLVAEFDTLISYTSCCVGKIQIKD